jgi:hypothetical protein
MKVSGMLLTSEIIIENCYFCNMQKYSINQHIIENMLYSVKPIQKG